MSMCISVLQCGDMTMISRRNFLKSVSAGGVLTALAGRAYAANPLPACSGNTRPTLVHPGAESLGGDTLNGEPIYSAGAPPAGLESVSTDHRLNSKFYKVKHYSNDSDCDCDVTTRYFLTVDVGPTPELGIFHNMSSMRSMELNTITDILIFNKTTGDVLFWRKIGSNDKDPSALFILDDALVNSGANLKIVVRCSQHGFWGEDVTIGSSLATDYKSYAQTIKIDENMFCANVMLRRPLVSYDAFGSSDGSGVLHRPVVNVISNMSVKIHLGGNLVGTGKHPRFGEGHYVVGGALYDQNGNTLGYNQNILYSQATDHAVVFENLHLKERGVKWLRAVMFDCLQGRFMGFKKIA